MRRGDSGAYHGREEKIKAALLQGRERDPCLQQSSLLEGTTERRGWGAEVKHMRHENMGSFVKDGLYWYFLCVCTARLGKGEMMAPREANGLGKLWGEGKR